jgi:hypothetical protein
MYESLLRCCADFHLYVFAFDDASLNYLRSREFPNLTVISLKEFEDPDLLNVKVGRSAGEYCWTCTSSTILYCLEKFGLENCTYIDADLVFYADPQVLVNELGDRSVLITEHRYTPEYEQSKTSGKYCVQFVTIKNDQNGMTVLKWWRDRCIEWCYARMEDGKFGDQKYLDDWTTRFAGVHELQHLGGGVAPWNVQQYSFRIVDSKIIGNELFSGHDFPVVFYHFHGVKFFEDDIVTFAPDDYLISDNVKIHFYYPYIRSLNQMKVKVNATDSSFNPNGSAGKAPYGPLSAFVVLIYYLKDVRKSLVNAFGLSLKKRIRHHYYYDSKKL